MEERELLAIRDALATLPELKKRLDKLDQRIPEEEQAVKDLHKQLSDESYDVERLEKESLSAMLYKFIGKYDEKLDKENQEMLEAKLAFDRAASEVKELQKEREEILDRISKLEKDKTAYQLELRNREHKLQNSMQGESNIQYKQLEAERESLTRQLFEIDEAQRAVNKVVETARVVMDHLESAESWANFDVWTRGGIFTHMAKYEHIDNAQEESNRLAAQMKQMQKELSDVDMMSDFGISEISGTTRAFDFWFDNIFTDLNVREQIRENIERMEKLFLKLEGITNKLEDRRKQLNKMLEVNEYKKNELLIHNI